MLKDNLTKLMQQHNVSVTQLSEETGISVPTLKKLRTTEDSNPTLDSLIKLSKFFDVGIDELTSHRVYSKDYYTVPMILDNQISAFILGNNSIFEKTMNIESTTQGIIFCVISTKDFFNFNAGCVLFCSKNSDYNNGDHFIGADGRVYKLIKNGDVLVALGTDQKTAIISQDFLYAKIVKIKYEVRL